MKSKCVHFLVQALLIVEKLFQEQIKLNTITTYHLADPLALPVAALQTQLSLIYYLTNYVRIIFLNDRQQPKWKEIAQNKRKFTSLHIFKTFLIK